MTRIFRGLFLMVKMKVEKNTLALLRFSEVSPGRKALIFSDGSPLLFSDKQLQRRIPWCVSTLNL